MHFHSTVEGYSLPLRSLSLPLFTHSLSRVRSICNHKHKLTHPHTLVNTPWLYFDPASRPPPVILSLPLSQLSGVMVLVQTPPGLCYPPESLCRVATLRWKPREMNSTFPPTGPTVKECRSQPVNLKRADGSVHVAPVAHVIPFYAAAG